MRNAHCMICNMAKNTEKRGKWETHTVISALWCETVKKVQNEKFTLFDLEYGKKITEEHGKWETHTVKSGLSCETIKKVQNEKCTLFDLEYIKKNKIQNTEKRGKWEMHTVGTGIWQ